PQRHVDVDIPQVVVPGPAHADDHRQGLRHGEISSRHTRHLKAVRQPIPARMAGPHRGAGAGPAPGAPGQGWTGPLGPRSRRSDCMIWKVVVRVKTSMSAAASTPVYLAMMGAAARSVTASRWPLTPAQKFSPPAT